MKRLISIILSVVFLVSIASVNVTIRAFAEETGMNNTGATY